MEPQSLSIPVILSLLIAFLSLSPPAAASPTAYDVIKGFNFPEGILPKGITGYELDEATGKFSAFLNGSCSFAVEGSSYQLKYKPTIGGYISQNRLTGLTGVSVKIVFLWFNIVEVVRDGDDLGFSVGIASANFPIDNFYESPQCGCGFDCVTAGTRKEAFMRLTYSRPSNLTYEADELIVKRWTMSSEPYDQLLHLAPLMNKFES